MAEKTRRERGLEMIKKVYAGDVVTPPEGNVFTDIMLEQVFAEQWARAGASLPEYQGELPEGHDGLGLGLLGIPGDRAVAPEIYERVRADVLQRVRGTVQADIL